MNDTATTPDAGNATDSVPGIENVIGSQILDTDHITGDTGTNRIEGLAGSDTFFAGDGADTLIGGADNDLMFAGNGNDLLEGNGGTDQLNGEADDDTVTFANAAAGVTADLDINSISADGDGASDFSSGLEHIVGSPFDDSLSGRNGQPNTINGGSGADTILGRSGGDTLDGDGGTDTASFQFAPAAITANLGTGVTSGGEGGVDTLADFENLFGAAARDDTLIGNSSANQLNGLSGDDFLRGRGGADTLIGGPNDNPAIPGNGDTADYSSASGGVTASLASGTASNDGDGSNDTLAQFEHLTGSPNGDDLTGDGAANTINALAGPDTIRAREGIQDRIDCGTETDVGIVDATETSITGCEKADAPGATATPQITGSAPGSGSNANSPQIQGSAPGGSTVTLYASADCSGGTLASGSAADFNGGGISISVADNSTTTISAKAADGDIDGDSGCSNTIEYAESTPSDPPPTGDTTPPDTQIDKLIKKTKDTTPTYKFSSTESDSTFECAVDKGDFASCKSPTTLKKLKKGKHTFFVQATDAAGNTDATPAEDKFEVTKKKKKK